MTWLSPEMRVEADSSHGDAARYGARTELDVGAVLGLELLARDRDLAAGAVGEYRRAVDGACTLPKANCVEPLRNFVAHADCAAMSL